MLVYNQMYEQRCFFDSQEEIFPGESIGDKAPLCLDSYFIISYFHKKDKWLN